MRRVSAVLVFLLLVTTHVYAQERTAALGRIRFGSTPAAVARGLVELGLKPSTLLGGVAAFPLDQTFEGRIDGRPVIVFAMYDARQSLEKMLVTFVTADTECVAFYRQFKEALAREFGGTHADVERWSAPYDDAQESGHEEAAIRTGKGFLGATWTREDGDATATMSLSVEGNLTVTLAYESSKWPSELERRRRTVQSLK